MANLPTIFLLFQALVRGFFLRNNQAKRFHALPANPSIDVFDMVCQIKSPFLESVLYLSLIHI